MELPHLGKHCDEKSCRQLDFLPMKCDACEMVFCKDHVRYELHSCQSAYKKDVQVPVCPLCNQPVPWKRGEAPDISVGDHIDRDCQSDPAKQKRKVMGNRCSVKGCKQKEVVPVICDQCKLNHCLKHRHPTDHSCKGNNPTDRAREAALARSAVASAKTTASKSRVSSTSTSSRNVQPSRSFSAMAVQGNLSEDEALARALQASLQNQPMTTAQQQEEADRLLSLSLQQSEQLPPSAPQAATAGGSSSSTSNNHCRLS